MVFVAKLCKVGSIGASVLLFATMAMASVASASGDPITGTVTDAQGNPIPNVAVVVCNLETNDCTTVYTDSNGDYSVNAAAINLQAGDQFSVTISQTSSGQCAPPLRGTTVRTYSGVSDVANIGIVDGSPPAHTISAGSLLVERNTAGAIDSSFSYDLSITDATNVWGQFSVAAGFRLVDNWDDNHQSPVQNRWYDFQVTVDYVAYIDGSCQRQAVSPAQHEGYNNLGEQSYTSAASFDSQVQTVTVAAMTVNPPAGTVSAVIQVTFHLVHAACTGAQCLRGAALPTNLDSTSSSENPLLP